ncbi:hypothetical protein KCP73_09060 [Salmonella enterica subsp. enterica]|nr:hypothetical protein KCP73_09060 [Salmonella enterica subsp. enterica]
MLSRRAGFAGSYGCRWRRWLLHYEKPRVATVPAVCTGRVHFRTDVTHGNDRLLQPFGIVAASSTCAALAIRDGCSMMVVGGNAAMTFTRCQMVSVMNRMIGCAGAQQTFNTVTSAYCGYRAVRTRNRGHYRQSAPDTSRRNWFR